MHKVVEAKLDDNTCAMAALALQPVITRTQGTAPVKRGNFAPSHPVVAIKPVSI